MANPTKLILINSATYAYGEILLGDSVHLIGDNNFGKSSLVNALQFFLIDDLKAMEFPKGNDETISFYFPSMYSYVLLEISCSDGYKTIGACKRAGKFVSGFERFVFDGQFHKDDFVCDNGEVRPTDKAKALLSAKNFTLLDGPSLRSALTGSGSESKGLNLGLIPVKDRDGYQNFRYIFKNLLKLGAIKQAGLKRMLIDVCSSREILAEELDPAKGHEEQHGRIAAESQKIALLEKNAERIGILATKNSNLKETREQLPRLYATIRSLFQHKRKEHEELQSKLISDIESTTQKATAADKEYDIKVEKLGRTNQALGVVQKQIEEHKKNADKYHGFAYPLEQATTAQLRKKTNTLSARIDGASQDDSAALDRQVQTLRASIEEDQKRLSLITTLLATDLAERHSKEKLQKIFTIHNPAILGLAIGHGGVEIHSQEAVDQHIESLLEHIQDEVYSNAGISIPLSSLSAPDLTAFTDPSVIGAKIKENSQEFEKLKTRLQAATETDRLRKEWKDFDSELQVKENTLREFERLEKEKRESLPGWEKEKGALEGKAQQLVAVTKELKEEVSKQRQTNKALQDELNRATEAFNHIKKQISALQPPPGWTESQNDNYELLNAKDLSAVVKDYWAGLQALKDGEAELDRDLTKLVMDGGYLSYLQQDDRGETDVEATLALLTNEVALIPEKKNRVEHDWHDLVIGMGDDFRRFTKGLGAVGLKVNELNRSLAKISISNLVKLQIIPDILPAAQNVREAAEEHFSPLFASAGRPEEALNQIKAIFKMGRLSLIDSFNLRFVVERSDGTTVTYNNLEVESNGTTVTIKVLIHMMFLKNLLQGNKVTRIPYFLDESTNVSEGNLKAIVDKSKELGFIPLLASTLPQSAARYLYFLEGNGQQRITIYPYSMVEITTDEQNAPGELVA